MAEVLKEVNWSDWVGQPIDAVKKVTKTKKKQHMLEEQIRDYIPCDVEPKEEENENI